MIASQLKAKGRRNWRAVRARASFTHTEIASHWTVHTFGNEGGGGRGKR